MKVEDFIFVFVGFVFGDFVINKGGIIIVVVYVFSVDIWWVSLDDVVVKSRIVVKIIDVCIRVCWR